MIKFKHCPWVKWFNWFRNESFTLFVQINLQKNGYFFQKKSIQQPWSSSNTALELNGSIDLEMNHSHFLCKLICRKNKIRSHKDKLYTTAQKLPWKPTILIDRNILIPEVCISAGRHYTTVHESTTSNSTGGFSLKKRNNLTGKYPRRTTWLDRSKNTPRLKNKFTVQEWSNWEPNVPEVWTSFPWHCKMNWWHISTKFIGPERSTSSRPNNLIVRFNPPNNG